MNNNNFEPRCLAVDVGKKKEDIRIKKRGPRLK
jgi:hypothetical protein